MNINKYVLAAMLSAGLLGSAAMAQEKTKIETKDYKLKEKSEGNEEKLKYEDANYKLKEKEKNGEVKIKSEGDPTKFNELTKSNQAAPSPSGSSDPNYYPTTPTVEVINGTSDSAISQMNQSYTDSSTSVDSKNISQKYKNDPAFQSSSAAPASSPNYQPATAPAPANTQQGVTADPAMPAGNYKYKQEKDETKIKTDAGKEKIKKDEVKIKTSDEKFKEKKDEVKIKDADGSKLKVDKEEVKIKGADGSKVKSNDNEYKSKDNAGDRVKITKNETVIKTPGSKEKIEDDKYKYKSDSLKVKVKK